jgi:hypothetical protein
MVEHGPEVRLIIDNEYALSVHGMESSVNSVTT